MREPDVISTDIILLPVPEMFASADKKVISWEGENYYRACGQQMYTDDGGTTSSCVKRVNHRHWMHEDFEGRQMERLYNLQDLPEQIRSLTRDVLKRTGLDDQQIFNALNALIYAGIRLEKGDDEQPISVILEANTHAFATEIEKSDEILREAFYEETRNKALEALIVPGKVSVRAAEEALDRLAEAGILLRERRR